MVVTKEKVEYTKLDPNFKPLPKYGHLSELDPEFVKLKDTIDGAIEGLWEPSIPLNDFCKLWSSDTPSPPDWPEEGREVLTELRKISTRDGGEVKVKIYQAKDKKPGSALVMRFHGGGWVVGGHCVEHPENLNIAHKTNSVVVSVNYRM
jgi:acetyl esterase/lipase